VLPVSAANVGDYLCIGPTSVDCGATVVHALLEGACCSVPLGLALCWTAKQCCATRLGCVQGVFANARCMTVQRLAGRLSVPS
jgi:ABC-type microcin C transport system permease subunit YejE